ncbi:MAG: hypothetical protein Kow0074_01240 [Candidatus Zixiibacteriota bacterium]
MTDSDIQIQQYFWQQNAARRALRAALDAGRLSRSYLFVGPEGVGKWAAAQWVAIALLCEQRQPDQRPCFACGGCKRAMRGTHPDLHLLFPVPKKDEEEHIAAFLATKRDDPFAVVRYDRRPNIAVDRVRDLLSELSKTAAEGGNKVAIIGACDQMHHDIHGILLKSIEEPPPGAYFILTTADPGRLPQTIHSRCQTIRFTAVDPDVIAERLVNEGIADPNQAQMAAHLSDGGWGNALRLCEEDAVAWRGDVEELWRLAFQPKMTDFLERSQAMFRGGQKFNETVQAFDIWSLLLWRDTRAAFGTPTGESHPVLSPPSLDVAWSCWKILQQGRATLWVNVMPRNAVRGTFLAIRRRLGY